MFKIFLFILVSIKLYQSKVLFYETFDDERYLARWHKSIENLDKQGTFVVTSGAGYIENTGIKTEDEYRYYLLSKKMKRRYSNKKRTLIIQLQIMFPSFMECGGAYIKVLGYDFEPSTFNSRTPYKIMFGPDICGYEIEQRDVKVILNYQGKYYIINQLIRFEVSYLPQLFTLILRPDNTYEVHVNMSLVAKGPIGKDFRMIRPKKIRDKSVKPPKDWEFHERIFDDSFKPPPHIRQPKTIVDPMFFENSSLFDPYNGLPYIVNPNYMKLWYPPIIKNPRWKGQWKYPLIPNPRYNPVDDFYLQTDIGGVGIDIWQMTSGVIYDSILITDNEHFARQNAKDNWKRSLDFAASENLKKKLKGQKPVDYSNEDDEEQELQMYEDKSGQQSCYNTLKFVKDILFRTRKNITAKETPRSLSRKRQKENMKYQLGLLPKVSLFDKNFVNIMKNETEFSEDLSLEKRLNILHNRKFSKTAQYIIQKNLFDNV